MADKKIIIFANGVLENPDSIRHLTCNADYIICADGGAIHCARLGVIPDLIIGDLDSIPITIKEDFERQNIKIEQHPADKDNTDLELALCYAQSQIKAENRGNTTIHILGGLGGRWDMSLATVFLLANAQNRQYRVFIHSKKEVISALHPGIHSLYGEPKQNISFLPLHGDVENLTLTGVRYPTKAITIRAGVSLGVSNYLTGKKCLIQFSKGILLVILEKI